ncbi:MAG TPA: flagellin, partial [Cyanobacteria bacterium UBA9579]|nr:flagellin [Cyanobacteria bacterium UBA9579]
ELTVQAANGTNGEAERDAIKSEIESLTSEINRVAKSTSFNNINLLDGSSSNLSLQTGPNADADTNSLEIGSALGSIKTEDLGMPTGADLDTALSSSANAAQMLDKIDSALSTINERRSNIGSIENRLESTVNSLQIKQENMLAAESRIRDVDIAKEVSKLTQNQILQNSSAILQAQANQNPAIALNLI